LDYCKTLNFGHPQFWRLSQFHYFGPRNFGAFASYYTETLLYSNFHGPLFSRTCRAREIREIRGTRKKRGFTVACYSAVSTILAALQLTTVLSCYFSHFRTLFCTCCM